ncbi:kelch-like protein 35 isoform X2 [Mixophyes fleayi]|uniref:kelch-like protein 35 isoform X2 n=1 Tax=Mixophyes fleayi TaxID=3061075 RepID=UPI003F4E388C
MIYQLRRNIQWLHNNYEHVFVFLQNLFNDGVFKRSTGEPIISLREIVLCNLYTEKNRDYRALTAERVARMKTEPGYEAEGLQNSINKNMAQEINTRPCCGTCHANDILQSLNISRQSGVFTDVTLLVDDKMFPCHRVVLSSKSPYFRAMFSNSLKETNLNNVTLRDVSASTLGLVLDFMYEGKLALQEDNVQDVLQVSDLLNICSLRDQCVKFIDGQLDPSNCVGIMKFADMFSIPSLSEKSKKLMLEGFVEVSCHEEFLQLSKEELIEYLSNDDLVVNREEFVFEAVMRWVKEDKSMERKALRDLLEHVRLPLLDPAYFLEKVETDKTIQGCPDCFPLLHEARMYHILGNRLNSVRVRPRRFMDLSELIIIIGGYDEKGVLKLPYIDSYDPKRGQWTALSGVPGYTKSEPAVCTLKNNIYMSGGHINSHHVWMLNAHINSWVKVALLNTGRWRHGMVALKGQIYCVGGFDGLKRLNTVERYNSFTNVWSQVAPMLEAVSSAAVVSCTNKLYVIGGSVADNTSTDTVQCYDPEENTWKVLTPAPFSREHISGVELDGTIYVVGGLMSAVFSYSPAADTWSEAAALPGPLESCGLTVCGGKIYIMGGRDENGKGTDRSLVFDPTTKTLSEVRALLRGTSHHGCVTILQRLRT